MDMSSQERQPVEQLPMRFTTQSTGQRYVVNCPFSINFNKPLLSHSNCLVNSTAISDYRLRLQLKAMASSSSPTSDLPVDPLGLPVDSLNLPPDSATRKRTQSCLNEGMGLTIPPVSTNGSTSLAQMDPAAESAKRQRVAEDPIAITIRPTRVNPSLVDDSIASQSASSQKRGPQFTPKQPLLSFPTSHGVAELAGQQEASTTTTSQASQDEDQSRAQLFTAI